ncbi:MAG: 4-hydroxy-tetrahydrodipicolinate reductase [Pseudomonadota bacterium]
MSEAASASSDPMRLVIVGAAGRMGRALIETVLDTEGCTLHAALEHDGSDALGTDAGTLVGRAPLGVPVTSNSLEAIVHAHGVIDFTTPDTTIKIAELAAQARCVHVVGTTGMGPDHFTRLDAAARHATIVQSGNMSLGVNLLGALVKQVAAALDEDFDIEIVEMHHRHKVDAPSGTALLLGDAAATGRALDLNERSVRVRDGHTGARNRGDIGFATLRGGSVVGEHSVIFAADGERLELTHKAADRGIFARGAVKAALWARGKKRGLYDMMDVLGLAERETA